MCHYRNRSEERNLNAWSQLYTFYGERRIYLSILAAHLGLGEQQAKQGPSPHCHRASPPVSTIPLGTVSKGLDVSLTMGDPPGFGADIYLLCNSFCPQVMPGHPQEIRNRSLRHASLICATPPLTADVLSCATIHSTEQGEQTAFGHGKQVLHKHDNGFCAPVAWAAVSHWTQ